MDDMKPETLKKVVFENKQNIINSHHRVKGIEKKLNEIESKETDNVKMKGPEKKNSPFKAVKYENITVSREDYECLDSSKWLNDSIIDTSIQFIKNKKPERFGQTHIFSSYFYKILTKGNVKDSDSHERVKKWTKNVDIFKIFKPAIHFYQTSSC